MKKLIFIFGLFLLFNTAVKTTYGFSMYTVTGFVYDSISGLGIPNHKIYFSYIDSGFVHQDSAITAQGGIYVFDYFLSDSTMNTITISTFGCNDYKYEQIITNPGSVEFVFFTICFLTPTPNCQAAFTYMQDSLYPLKVHFSDTSAGLINAWFWDFGDGATSTLKNPVHTYIQPGTYQVSLSVGNTMNPLYTSTNSLAIVIAPMYILAGQIMADQFPIQSQAKVILYRIIGLDWIGIDTSMVDSSGVYYFYQIPQGAYSLRAIPTDPDLSKDFLPTYFAESLNWEDANIITLQDSIYTNSFGLIKKPLMSGGTGVLSGHIFYTNGTSTAPASEIEMLVLSISHEGINADFSAPDGGYFVGGLMPGDYLYHAEIPGNTASAYTFFTIGNSGSDTVVANLTIQNNAIGIQDIGNLNSVSNVYPNPALESVTIEIISDKRRAAVLTISDFTGRSLLKENIHLEAGSNSIYKDLTIYTSGIYFISIDLGMAGKIGKKILH